eukprot:scaffold61555_cov68-Phaeocystis_antarctica.AAC.4
MSAVWFRLVGKSTLAPRFSSSLTISNWPLPVAACSRAAAVVRPSSVGIEWIASTVPPFNHLTTFCSSPRWADSNIAVGRRAEELTAGSTASDGAAGAAAAGGGGAACCRMSSAMAVSVLALARSRACTHASCPPPAASIRADPPLLDCRSGLAECCRRRSRIERWPWAAAAMSAVWFRLVGKSTLAPRSSSSLTISTTLGGRWLRRRAAGLRSWSNRPLNKAERSTGPPSRSHFTTLCSSPRPAE